MQFEYVLSFAGGYDRYQKRLLYLFMSPVTILVAVVTMNTLFLVTTPDHYCHVPELSNLTKKEQEVLIRPKTVKQGLHVPDSCKMYDVDYNNLLKIYIQIDRNLSFMQEYLSNKSDIPCQSGWIYDHQFYDETAVTHFDLVCDHSHWVGIILTIDGAGKVFGSLLFGMTSDLFGRRTTFYITALLGLISTISPLFIRDFSTFVATRFTNGMLLSSIFQTPLLILMEFVEPSQRARINGMSMVTWTIGMCLLSLVAYLTRGWITLSIVVACICAYFFIYIKWLPESPRWLISKGCFKKALKVLSNCAKVNGTTLPSNTLENLKKVEKYLSETSSHRPSMTKFITEPRLRLNFILVTITWMANVSAYYGTMLNFENFVGNQFLNFFALSSVELFSGFAGWYLMNTRLGRRWSNTAFLFSGALFFILPSLVPPEYPHLVTVFALIGRFSMMGSYVVVYQIAQETFPTPLRNRGMTVAASIAAMTNFAAPYLSYLGRKRLWLPLLVTGLISSVACLTSMFLPETMHLNLPQSVDDSSQIRNKSFFRFAHTSGIKESKKDKISHL